MIPIINASLNLTQNCTLNCEYCFCGEKTDKIMTLETAKKCVDFLIKQAVEAKDEELINKKREINVSFWGGEPLLEWELLKEIVLYAKQIVPKGVGVQFGGTTNGMLLTPDKFDFLDKHKVFFMVSLDGTKETHDKHRVQVNGNGSHKYIMKNMKQVLKRWPFYKVRTSPYPERIDHFYEDIKYLTDHGCYNIMFSPVYEHKWEDKHWEVWKDECFKVVDMITEYRKKGIKIEIEHFKSYCRSDNSKWPCGAGRFYVGFDTDGSLWPCHRFIKFSDQRPWQEKEMCIGHVDFGITQPETRQQFIDFKPECGDCKYKDCTPCLTGDVRVSLLNGTEVPIEQLVGKKDFYVYSCQEDGKIVPGLVSAVWKTGTKQVIKVTLDNEEFFKCTPDHLLMLRDGTYKQAKDCFGESMMPLYRGLLDGYETIKSNYDQQKYLTYKMVDYHFNGQNINKDHVHHVNYDKSDNAPGNLRRMTCEDHSILHVESVKKRNAEGISGWSAAYQSEQFRQKKSLAMTERNKRNWSSPIYREKMAESSLMASGMAVKLWDGPEYRRVHSQMNAEAGKIGGANGKGKIAWNAGLTKEMDSRIVGSTAPRPNTIGHPNYQKEDTGKKISAAKKGKFKGRDNPNYKHGKCCQTNHKIINIEYLGIEDVYDFTVEKYHNFALQSGIFVHNCNGGCYGINYDLTGKINTPYSEICKYVNMQHKVSLYLKEKIGGEDTRNMRSCICYNMCYLEGTSEEIIDIDNKTEAQCHCNNTNYTGDPDTEKVARPIRKQQINPLEILRRVEKIEKNSEELRSRLDEILAILKEK